LREKEENLVLLDAGGMFPTGGSDRKIQANVCLKIMDLMKYDAVNLGVSELVFGMDYLQEQSSNMTIPLISTNLTSENAPFFLNDVIRKDLGDARVAIFGVMSIDGFNFEKAEGIHVSAPTAVIKEKISEASKDADFIVLLSQLAQEQLNTLLGDVEGIDLVIACQYSKKEVLPAHIKTPIVKIRPRGFELGYVKLEKDNSGRVNVLEDKKIRLDKSIPEDSEVSKLVTKFYRQNIKEERIVKKRKKIEEEARELWKLSPREYIEQLQKNGETERR